LPLSQELNLVQNQTFEQDYSFFKKIKDAYACNLGEGSMGINETHDWNVIYGEKTTTLILKEKQFIDNYPDNYKSNTADFGIGPGYLK
jgi:hypothetical protein